MLYYALFCHLNHAKFCAVVCNVRMHVMTSLQVLMKVGIKLP